MSLEEIVAMFLYTLAHHKKNRSIGQYFLKSGETVSWQFNLCLSAILKLHQQLLKKPTPIKDDCEDERWKCFKVLILTNHSIIELWWMQMDNVFSFVELLMSPRWYIH